MGAPLSPDPNGRDRQPEQHRQARRVDHEIVSEHQLAEDGLLVRPQVANNLQGVVRDVDQASQRVRQEGENYQPEERPAQGCTSQQPRRRQLALGGSVRATAVQRAGQLGSGLVTVFRMRMQTPADDAVQQYWNPRIPPPGLGRPGAAHGRGRAKAVRRPHSLRNRFKGLSARHQLEEHDPKRIDVRALVH